MAAKYDFTIWKGATFEETFTISKNGAPVDLTGCSAKVQLRASATDPTVLLEFSAGTGLTIGPLLGKIYLSKSATETAALTFSSAVYDIRIVLSDGKVLPPPFGGIVTVTEVVTK